MKIKKKVPTLPNHITPVMPDFTSGIDKFNDSCDTAQVSSNGSGIAEEMKKINFDSLRSSIVNATINYLISEGFEEDDARAYSDFEFEDVGNRFRCEVRAEISFDEMGELSEILNPIVQKYDKDSYFDFVDSGILEAFIYKNSDIKESLKTIDINNIHNGIYSDLTGLYESTQAKLDSKDKKKLADFVSKTDDVQEIETYINGLLSTKNESLLEYIETSDDLENEFDKYIKDCDRNIYDELPEWCKIYLDEFDAPWIFYGKLPTGACYYSDDYDTYFFDDINDFIQDQKYNLLQDAEMYKEDPGNFDYSDKFVELLTSDLNKTLSESLLNEAGGYPDDMGSKPGDYGPMSPWYSGPEPQSYDFTFEAEPEVKIEVYSNEPNDWEFVFDNSDKIYPGLFFYGEDGEYEFTNEDIISGNRVFDRYIADDLYDTISRSEELNSMQLEPGIYAVDCAVSMPYDVYGDDLFDLDIEWDNKNSTSKIINIKRIS